VQCRGRKHWNPKWKWHRTQKVVKLELPDFHDPKDKPENMTDEEMRTKFKEKGMSPPRHWNERPIFIGSTGGVFEPYVPAEGDGKKSFISKEVRRNFLRNPSGVESIYNSILSIIR